MITTLRMFGLVLASMLLIAASESSHAQQVTTQYPFQTNGTRFFEQSNVSWSIHSPHQYISFNGGGVTPPFGGYQPNAGLSGGFATGNARLSFNFAQGYSSTSSTISPVLTTTNGYPGSLFIGRTTPFVVGLTPIVGNSGGNAAPVALLAQRIATGELPLDRGNIVASEPNEDWLPPAPVPHDFEKQLANRKSSVPPVPANVQRQSAPAVPAPETTADDYFQRGMNAERDGKTGLAKVYYQLAVSRDEGLVRLKAEARLKQLGK